MTSGKGVNYAIEATGVTPAAKAAFTALAMRGVMVRNSLCLLRGLSSLILLLCGRFKSATLA